MTADQRASRLPEGAMRAAAALAVFLALAAPLVLLTGCSSEKPSAAEPAAEQQAELHSLTWPSDGLAAMLPFPEHPYGTVSANSDAELRAELENVDRAFYESYSAACMERGFDMSLDQREGAMTSENPDGYELGLSFDEAEGTMSIALGEPRYSVAIELKCSPNLIFSRYDLEVRLDGSWIGDIAHGESRLFARELPAGRHELEAASSEDGDVKGALSFDVEGDCELAVMARCSSKEVQLQLGDGASDEDGLPNSGEAGGSAAAGKSLAKNEVEMPFGSYEYVARPYKKAVAALKRAGFSNVKAKAIYDLDTPNGGLFSAGVNEVEDISIGGDSRFSEGDVFKKKDKAVVRYHRLAYENPKIKWASRSVAQLFDELDNNAMRAKKAYEGKFLTITGYLDVVDASGGYIALTPSNSGFDLYTIRLDLHTDAQRGKVERMSRGDRVIAKVRVDSVGEIIGYHVSLYKFV